MLAGGNEEAALYEGGVREFAVSWIFVEYPAIGSGDRECRSGCGTVSPKTSLRSTLEYVRFASSAKTRVLISIIQPPIEYAQPDLLF